MPMAWTVMNDLYDCSINTGENAQPVTATEKVLRFLQNSFGIGV